MVARRGSRTRIVWPAEQEIRVAFPGEREQRAALLRVLLQVDVDRVLRPHDERRAAGRRLPREVRVTFERFHAGHGTRGLAGRGRTLHHRDLHRRTVVEALCESPRSVEPRTGQRDDDARDGQPVTARAQRRLDETVQPRR